MSAAALSVCLAFLASCEYWEDWCDRDKPEPSDPITQPPKNAVSYTREEAVSLICNKLIMRFSRLPNKPVVTCGKTDVMAGQVESLLKKSNVVSSNGIGNDLYQIESRLSDGGTWHPVVVHVLSGKTILDEIVPLRDAVL